MSLPSAVTTRFHRLVPPREAGIDVPPWTRARWLLWLELAVVLLVSLGRSAIYSIVDLLEKLTAPGGLSQQTAPLNSSVAPDRPWFDLTYQLLINGFRVVPVVLAGYLLVQSGVALRTVWFRHRSGERRVLTGGDVGWGTALAAGVGSVGLVFYLVSYAFGFSAKVVASGLDGGVWWHVPVLVIAAISNAVVEEFLVLGYVLLRLRQAGYGDLAALLIAAVLRGAYHLYQGFGGFVGNAVMGVLFGWLYLRWGRVMPLVIAHTLLDVGAFVGYALLAGRVGWIPV